MTGHWPLVTLAIGTFVLVFLITLAIVPRRCHRKTKILKIDPRGESKCPRGRSQFFYRVFSAPSCSLVS